MNELYNQITSLLKNSEKPETVLEQALRRVLIYFSSETGTIHILDSERQLLFLAAQLGLPPAVIAGIKIIPVGKGIAGQTVARGKPVAICNLQTDNSGVAQPGALQSGIGGMICVPLYKGETIAGTIGIGTTRQHEYTVIETRELEEVGRLIGSSLNLKPSAAVQPLPSAAMPQPSAPGSSGNSLAELTKSAADAWRRRDHQQSLELLERAHRLAPNEPRILLGLGRLHGLRCDYDSAGQFFDKAIRAAGWDNFTFVAAGDHSVFFGRHEMGRHYFERALKQNGESVEALVSLAEVNERQHRLDAASELVDRALRVNGGNPQALLARARFYRLTGKPAEAEKVLQSFVNKPDSDILTRAKAWYELGMNLDRQARYDEAMTAFLEAKALLLPRNEMEAFAQLGTQLRLKKIEQVISADLLKSWHDAAFQPQHRLAVLCGHPRSGTTLLEQVLDSHPDIVSSEETMIFQNEALTPLVRGFLPDEILKKLNLASPAQIRQSRENYFRFTDQFLENPVGRRLLIDKNPSLTPLIPALTRIFPESKFLIALRDPRDVCLSCFMQYLPANPVSSSYLSLEGTVNEYASVMSFWLAIKPHMANPWLEVRYEDLVGDLESVARRALEFLGAPWDERVLGFDQHARSKVVRSPTYADVSKPIFKGAVGRWRNYQKYLEPHLEKLAPFVKAFGYE